MLWAVDESHAPARLDVTHAVMSYAIITLPDRRQPIRADHDDQIESLPPGPLRSWLTGFIQARPPCPRALPFLAPYGE